jgi:hypothetical protein
MRSLVLAATVAVAGASCGGAQKPPTVKQIAERSKPAIVRIEAKDRVGTGFAIDPSGIIVTNLHVVVGMDAITVKLFDGRSFDVKRVLGFDLERDLALLALDLQQPMPYLTIGDSTKVEPGDPVVVIGNPLGIFDYTVSDGLLSGVRNFSPEVKLLQISAPISQGSSGGPLFNSSGEVIGIATAIFTEGQNLNFAMPSEYLQPILSKGKQLTVAEFAEESMRVVREALGGEVPTARIERKVPIHDVSVLDGCSDADVIGVAQDIAGAIEIGAPLYNRNEIEACFKIYEMTSQRLAKDAKCQGVREAFKSGLDRAAGMETFSEKAWALRDTFDGMLDVIDRRGAATP